MLQNILYLRLIFQTSIDRDMELRSGFGKMAESLILLLCPCIRLDKKFKATRTREKHTCLNIEGVVSVYLFDHERLISRNIEPDPKRLLKVSEGTICAMDR